MSRALPLPQPLDDDEVRRALGCFPSGVTLVTAPGGLALVVSSFTSVSLTPPLVAFCPSLASLTWRRMRRDGRFGVNILPASYAEDIRERARPGADRLGGLDVEFATCGVPVVGDALAFLGCSIASEHLAGDHAIVVGRVREVRRPAEGVPLVHHASGLATVEPL